MRMFSHSGPATSGLHDITMYDGWWLYIVNNEGRYWLSIVMVNNDGG